MSEDTRPELAPVEPEALPNELAATEDGRNRSDVEALKDGAAMLTQAGNRVAALALMWSAVAIDPLDLGAHRRLAAMLANAGDIDGAANEYARYIDFLLPVGDVPRAAMELAYGAKVLGAHKTLHEAAEKIAGAVRSLVPELVQAASLPAPRLLPTVAFHFCVHEDGDKRWMQLEGGTAELIPTAVRLLDRDENVMATRKCLALSPGQRGHASLGEGEPAAVVWVVLGLPNEVAAALDGWQPGAYRFQAQVGDDWLAVRLVDTGCRIGRRGNSARSAIS